MTRLAHDGAIAAIGLVLTVLVNSACSPTIPSPPISSPEPTSMALVSPAPTPAPVPGPSILCEQPQAIEGVSFETPTCEAAVQVALAELAHVDRRVAALDFRYGSFCPPGYYCVLNLPPLGHVVATLADGARFVVNVRGEPDGQITVIGVRLFPTTEPAPTESVDFSDPD